MGGPHIFILARTPTEGRVKTRLIGRLTPQQVTDLHGAMIADTAEMLASVPLEAERWILFSDEPPAMDLPEGLLLGRQAGGDLGQRMAAAIHQARASGAGKAILLGSDCPHVPPERLVEAERGLEAAELVLGPSEDGGFYLLGARPEHFSAALFKDVEWGSARVFDQTAAAARAAGLRLIALPPSYDLDTYEDLLRLLQEAPAPLRTCGLLRTFLKKT